ncbi:hypothetical protein ES705_44169 [subsurface metagenome]
MRGCSETWIPAKDHSEIHICVAVGWIRIRGFYGAAHGREFPDRTFVYNGRPFHHRYHLIDLPKVSSAGFETSGRIAVRCPVYERRWTARAEVHIVRGCAETCRPAKGHIYRHIFGTIGRIRVRSFYDDGREAPDITGDYRTVGLDLIDMPPVTGVRFKSSGIIVALGLVVY